MKPVPHSSLETGTAPAFSPFTSSQVACALTAAVVTDPAIETPGAANALTSALRSSGVPSDAGSTTNLTMMEPPSMLTIWIRSALIPPRDAAMSARKLSSKVSRSGVPASIEAMSVSSVRVATRAVVGGQHDAEELVVALEEVEEA